MRATGFAGIFIETRNLYSFRSVPQARESIPLNQDSVEAQSFDSAVRQDLDTINSRPIGSELLKLIGHRTSGIGASGRAGLYVSIRKAIVWDMGRRAGRLINGMWDYPRLPDPEGVANSVAEPAVPRPAQLTADPHPRRPHGFPHAPSHYPRPEVTIQSSVIQYNPGNNHHWQAPAVVLANPNWLVLAHELIHSYHGLSGTKKDGADGGIDNEELYTVGLGRYWNTRISENSIRREHGLALRDRYDRYAAATPHAFHFPGLP